MFIVRTAEGVLVSGKVEARAIRGTMLVASHAAYRYNRGIVPWAVYAMYLYGMYPMHLVSLMVRTVHSKVDTFTADQDVHLPRLSIHQHIILHSNT
jgi:hypothetical protein